MVALRALKEGDIIVPGRCLLFTSPRNVAEFVNGEGNSALLDGPLMTIKNIATPSGETMTLHAVFVGLAMFIRDFRGKRQRPNAAIEISTSKGANDGFINFAVQTRNGVGIAAGSPIVVDYGEHYKPTAVNTDSAPAKRFRGAIDVVFARQMDSLLELPKAEPEKPEKVPEKVPEKPVPSTPPKAPSGSSSETELSSTSDYVLIYRKGELIIRSKGGAMRIPPKTVVHIFASGAIGDAPAGQSDLRRFKFEKQKKRWSTPPARRSSPWVSSSRRPPVPINSMHTPRWQPRASRPQSLRCRRICATPRPVGPHQRRQQRSNVHRSPRS